MKALIKQIIIDFHSETIPSVIPRPIKNPSVDQLRKAKVFIGMRRSGKTYLMYQYMHDLINQGLEQSKIFYINFEDDRLINFTVDDFQAILDAYFELYPNYSHNKDLHFFFDEIQNILGWEKFIRRLLDKEYIKIYITGSSAKALSKEISTSLRGRNITTEVFPLSFYEVIKYHQVPPLNRLSSKQLSLVRHFSNEYLIYGGFPETLFIEKEQRRMLMQDCVNAVVYRDVIERHSISNSHIVKLFLNHCLQNTASAVSITKIYNILKSNGEMVGKNSLFEYLDYFADSFLLYPVPIYDLSLRKRQVNPKKMYCADPGIINAYSINPEMSRSASLENAVFNELRRYHENIFYHKTITSKEVDFVIQGVDGSIHLYQACLSMNNEETKIREINALIEASKELQAKTASVITMDEELQITSDKINISVIPFWKMSELFDGIK